MSSVKAQVFSPDFVVASVIFILILVILNVHTQGVYEKIEKQENMLYYESLVSTTDLLLLYHGYPKYWNETNVEILGLAERPNHLNRTKVEQMMNMSEERIKSLLNLGGKSFRLTIENSTGVMFEKGDTDWSDAETIYIINRNAIMDGIPVKIKFLVW